MSVHVVLSHLILRALQLQMVCDNNVYAKLGIFAKVILRRRRLFLIILDILKLLKGRVGDLAAVRSF